uniref:U19-Hexatoxin-Hf1a_1 n=1 Tax=Hadronyche formidabilis TaxID=426499 RepID=A0A4Q8K8B6_HADFO
MNTLIALGVLLLLSTTLGDTDDKVSREEMLERTELSGISEELLLQQLEAVEAALMEKERLEEMEEDGNSREKRCMALNVPCDSHFKCCKNLVCQDPTLTWFYASKYCYRKKS